MDSGEALGFALKGLFSLTTRRLPAVDTESLLDELSDITTPLLVTQRQLCDA